MAGTGSHFDDFFTATFRDAAFTTALWDTVAGEIRLPGYPISATGTLAGIGDVRDLAMRGDLLLAADAQGNLRIIDTSSPDTLRLISSLALNGPLGVDAAGRYAYVADGAAGLAVVDLASPQNLVRVGTHNTVDAARGVAVDGSRVAVAVGSAGVELFDVSRAALPGSLSVITTPGYAFGVDVDGTTVYVADGSGGMRIIDASNPAVPVLLTSVSTVSPAQSVYARDGMAWVATGTGVTAVDVKTPAAPVVLGEAFTSGGARSVAASGTIAWVSDLSGTVSAFDFVTPSAPRLVSSASAGSIGFALAASGSHVFAGLGSGGIRAVRVATPVTVPASAAVPAWGDAIAASISGHILVTAGGASGMTVYDATHPWAPVRMGQYDSPGSALDLDVSGGLALLADGVGGVRVIRVSNMASPQLLSSIGLPGAVVSVAFDATAALVCDGNGLSAVDLSVPEIPNLRGAVTTPGDARAVVPWGTYAFVLDGAPAPGLRVVDAGRIDSLVVAGSLGEGADVLSMAARGGIVYIGRVDGVVDVVDARVPGAPVLAGSVILPAPAKAIDVDGDAGFALTDSGVVAIDVSNPIAPVLGATGYSPGAAASDIAVAGAFLYVETGPPGVAVVQIRDRRVDPTHDESRSLRLSPGNDDVVSVRVSASATDSVLWSFSGDGGTVWTPIAADSAFHRLAMPGADLRWRTDHIRNHPGTNPTLSSVKIDWLGSAAQIDSVVDVPNDGGGWVRLGFCRSGYDVAGEPDPVTFYTIYRRLEAGVLPAAAMSAETLRARVDRFPGAAAALVRAGVRRAGGRYLASGSSFPPGTWEAVGFVGATQSASYLAAVPTLGDSNSVAPVTVVLVAAHAGGSGSFWLSNPDSGYSVNNTADLTPPAPPAALAVYADANGNVLRWKANSEPDFLYYNVYRDTVDLFIPGVSNRVHQTFATTWTDPYAEIVPHWYAITAVDTAGNESAPARFYVATAAGGPGIVWATRLLPGVPNPFNPSTMLTWTASADAGHVTLQIYDVSGRLVRTLESGVVASGLHRTFWDGSDDRGMGAASGVYFARLRAHDAVRTQKLTLVR